MGDNDRTIAAAAAELVPAGSSIFLNHGPLALAFAEVLAERRERCWIATSALDVAARLARTGTCDVVVLGGQLRGGSFGTVGPLATTALERLVADVAVIDCDGVDARGGVRAGDRLDAEVARVMARHADRTVVLADAARHGDAAGARVLPWTAVDDLVTDALDPHSPFAETLRDARVAVHVV